MKRIAWPFLLAALVALVGCSEPTGPRTMRVWGDVSLDGKPVEQGTITFDSIDGSAPAQAEIKDGRYDLPAASGPVSEKTYKIRINAPVKTGKTVPNVMPTGGPTMDVLAESIPEKFHAKSSIQKTISPDASKNEFSFKLTKAGSYE
ncbi:hypothetical protein [Paludisphaera rhizosphaerae]|uniref:hypothetical protein n=1 Tax=Paludisphaera rhizosphaerae TaxID=2711216 RepID=UPI0013ECA27C|nr:hypothetical protein [Paludisphaera rhizosphaerae]